MPKQELKVGVIGMGRVGPAIASALRAAGTTLVGVTARSPESRDRAEAMLPGVPVLSAEEVAKAADVVFVAVPDSQISSVVEELVNSGSVGPGQILVHLSGAQGIAPLVSAERVGALAIALHPVMTFSGTSLDILRMLGCPIAYTCAPITEPFALALIEQLGGLPVKVREADRPLYHAALAHVANHLVTLIVEGELVLATAGIDEPSDVIRPLVEAALSRALAEGIGGLTGPVSRGDLATLDAHLSSLDQYPELAQVARSYRTLVESTRIALQGETDRPKVARTKVELLRLLRSDPRETALVMTMGALHQGHLRLVEVARRHAAKVVVTIFVNPEQFGPTEDYGSYPRTLEQDVEKLAEVGADIVYAPSVEEVYPEPTRVQVTPGPAGRILEGYLRPGHFPGVLQVVSKMFDLIRPQVAVFGQKDAQQFVNIRQLVEDLDQQIELIQAPIVRSKKGLALSSRNAYLSEQQKKQALALVRSLDQASELANKGGSPQEIVDTAVGVLLDAEGVEPQYVALADAKTFRVFGLWSGDGDQLGVELEGVLEGPIQAYLLVAAQVGPARLIDNVLVEVNGNA